MRADDHVLVKLPNGASWIDEIDRTIGWPVRSYELKSGVTVKAECLTHIALQTAIVECSQRTPAEIHAWANHLRDFVEHYISDRNGFGIWADALYQEAFNIISGSMRQDGIGPNKPYGPGESKK